MGRRTKLHLASNLSFSTDVITEVIDLIAKRGSGKTYTATKLAEEMLQVGAQVVVIDPVGNWYGLRLGANGRSDDGLDIKILGGRNGDIPLEHTAGNLIAKTVVETGMSVILDVSMLSKVKQRRFVTDFASALLEYRKRDPAAMHIFWEEAYRFMPQKMAKGSKNEMLEATEELVTMGRNFGIGGTIICQRSAQISKTVLTQAGILIAMNTKGPADKKVIMDWMEVKDLTLSGLDKDLIVNLARLKKGEAYVWWPEEFGVKQIMVSTKQTFNASATPKFGEKSRKRKLKPIDLGALEAAMVETIEKVKGEDPRLLKRRIAELEKEVQELKNRPKEIVEVPAIPEEVVKRFEFAVEGLKEVSAEVVSATGLLNLRRTAQVVREEKASNKSNGHKKAVTKPKVRRAVAPNNVDAPKITAGALRMLKSLAAVSPGGLTKKQVATAAGMKSSSGTFGTYWSKLNVAEFIEEQSDKRWYITTAGMDFLGDDIPQQPDSPEEKVDFWCDRLSGKAKEMLRFLFNNHGDSFTKAEIAEEVGLTATSGTFGTYLSSLTANNLAVRNGGQYEISPDLMV